MSGVVLGTFRKWCDHLCMSAENALLHVDDKVTCRVRREDFLHLERTDFLPSLTAHMLINDSSFYLKDRRDRGRWDYLLVCEW